ncbi:hypothetical protein HYV80_04375 [Candidatus Woesearchaeota archaeon]|nr:hypothetical protein [Candidatus Woesearchaeota archaeon]
MNKDFFEYDDNEKNDFLDIGVLLSNFNDLEYQIDELIALFYGRYNMMDVFIQHINDRIQFNDKLFLLKKILDISEVRKFRTLNKSDFKFMDDFKQIRNVVAHGSYMPKDGDWPSSISTHNSKIFKLEDKKKLLDISGTALRIGKTLLEINLHFSPDKKNLPTIEMDMRERWFQI